MIYDKYQKTMLNGLPTILWDDCIALLNEVNQNKKQTVRQKYHFGLLVKKVDVMNITSRERKEIINKIQDFLGIKNTHIVGRIRRLVSIFTEKEVEKLIEVDKNGYCVGWGHFDMVMVDYLNKEQMIFYLKYARENKTTCNKLHNKIMEDQGREKDPQGRKKPKSAKEFVADTQKYLISCQETDNLLLSVHPKTVQAWMNTIDVETKRSMISQLDKHISMCNRLREKLA